MSMIKVENLTFSYPSSCDNIFEDVSFQIDTDWKLGFVGRNGRGKTTFLHLLLGKYEYTGTILSSVTFDYFPYPIDDKTKWTKDILQEICPAAEEWQFLRELSYLEVDADVLWRAFDTLSNGEQTKVLLAALFLNEGHFLLIDEPTNHLDAKARELVSVYLKKKKGFLLVSHDRHFLDGCVDHILSLNRASIDVQCGNFSSWATNFKRQQESEAAQNEFLKKDIKRLQKSMRRTSAWSDKIEASKFGSCPPDRGYIGHKSAKMMKRSKSIEARQQKAIKEKSGLLKNTETAESLKLFPMSYHTDRLASFSDVQVFYKSPSPIRRHAFRDTECTRTTFICGDASTAGRMQAYDEKNAICDPISFTIMQGERIALTGRNGSGKSSLLKLLTGASIKYTGTISVGCGLVISYVPQDTSFLKGTLSAFAEENQIDESLFKAVLRKMDLERIQFEKNMEDFSGGQKKKVLIAKSLCEQAHLYVWDEPLNFIDVYSRIQIEELIKEFCPTMIFVEHDRAFRDAIATKIVSCA